MTKSKERQLRQQAESRQLEKATCKNLEALGYGE